MSAEDMTNEMTNEELEDEELDNGMSDLEAFLDGDMEDEEEECEDEDGMSSLRDLFEMDDDENEEEEDDIPVSKVVTEIAQPVKITTSVGAEVDSKGQLKPNCKFTIERSITTGDDEFEIMENDFESLIERVKMTIAAIKGEN